MGQTRPVVGMCPILSFHRGNLQCHAAVKTVIIRGTSEHIMMQRRNALKSSSSKAPAQALEEPAMREFIAVSSHADFSSQSI
jgi:hypothetical protein